MFKPILTESDLPQELQSHETFQLDFKATASTAEEESFEKAKDVAALANNLGGVVLVGAQEDRSNKRLGRYAPLAERNAADVTTAYDEAVRDRCFPKPLMHVARIALTTRGGGFVIAVNVWPFPGQPVGVKSIASKDAFAFPTRVGTQTTYLTPDQLPMFMLPEVRRVVILLDSIPQQARSKITLYTGRPGGGGKLVVMWVSTVQDAMFRNTMSLMTVGGDTQFTIPADSVTHVWASPSGSWFIATSMSIGSTDNELFAMP